MEKQYSKERLSYCGVVWVECGCTYHDGTIKMKQQTIKVLWGLSCEGMMNDLQAVHRVWRIEGTNVV